MAGPVEMSVAHAPLYEPLSSSTSTSDGPSVKVGGSLTGAIQKRIVAGAEQAVRSQAW